MRSKEVPVVLCCDNVQFLFRVYQDTLVNVTEVIDLIKKEEVIDLIKKEEVIDLIKKE